jgi:hypothetical protein
MNLTRDIAPTTAEILGVLSVADLKTNLKITHSAEDTFLQDSILEAYDWLAGESGWLNRSVLTERWTLKIPGFKRLVRGSDSTSAPIEEWTDTEVITLPRSKMLELVTLKYRDEDNVLTTLYDSSASPAVESDVFHIVKGGTFGMLVLADGESWPTTAVHPEAVEITYSTGYGDATAVQRDARGIIKAMKLLAGDFYQNREDSYQEPRLVAVNRKIENGVQRIAGQYRIPNGLV